MTGVSITSTELKLAAINRVAAMVEATVQVTYGPEKSGHGSLEVEIREVGVKDRKPAWPLVRQVMELPGAGMSETAEFALRIGTPFLWSAEDQPRYALLATYSDASGVRTRREAQFGFTAESELRVTREISDAPPAPVEPPVGRRSVWVVGDSTAFSYGPNQQGWGDELQSFLNPAQTVVRNRARPGRSTRSYRNEGLWQRVLDELQPGDPVLLQFGHNDADVLAEGRCRGVLPGIGPETQESMRGDGVRETIQTFGGYLRQFVTEARAVGAQPVLLSLTVKNAWWGERMEFPQSPYGEWSAAVAQASGVPFIDLTARLVQRYETLGPALVQTLFCSRTDNVHTSPAGARLNAACIHQALHELHLL